MKRLIIDTDPGMDDAVAILTAFNEGDDLEVGMITTVGGNVPLTLCTQNALRLCALMGRTDIPVHEGCPKAILRPCNAVFHIHGENGLGAAQLPAPTRREEPTHAVPAMIEFIRRSPGKVTVAALAPPTNIALALTMAPDIVSNIDSIVVMGGSFSGGNITPYASYNFHSDPHAARILFESGAPLVMVGLDVTRQIKPSPEWLAELEGRGSKAGRFVAEMWRGSSLGFNDACVILQILDPSLFGYERLHVDIEIADAERIGQTTRAEGPANAEAALSVDRERAFRRLAEALAR